MKNKLISILETFGFPVFLQGTLNPDEAFPESFITFWVDAVDDAEHFDNEVNSWNWSFSVMFYSSLPELVNTKSDEIRKALKAAGFVPQGKGYDIPSGEVTHTGWAMDFIFNEKKSVKEIFKCQVM